MWALCHGYLYSTSLTTRYLGQERVGPSEWLPFTRTLHCCPLSHASETRCCSGKSWACTQRRRFGSTEESARHKRWRVISPCLCGCQQPSCSLMITLAWINIFQPWSTLNCLCCSLHWSYAGIRHGSNTLQAHMILRNNPELILGVPYWYNVFIQALRRMISIHRWLESWSSAIGTNDLFMQI